MRAGVGNIGIAALLMLSGIIIIGAGAPRPAKASRRGGDPAPGASRPRPPESRRDAARKPTPRASIFHDVADFGEEESEEDEHWTPTVPPAGPFSAPGPGRPRGVRGSRFAGRPSPRAPSPLFLLCGRLVC